MYNNFNHPKVKSFIRDLKRLCKDNNIELQICLRPLLTSYGSFYEGYFDVDKKKLAIASGNEKAVGALVHESCHLNQFLENDKTLLSTYFPKSFLESNNKHIIFDKPTYEGNWILGEWILKNINLTKKQLDLVIKRICDNERDCEIRTIKQIKKLGFDEFININEYIRDANIYILSYQLIKDLKTYPVYKKIPREVPIVYSKFSDKKIYKKDQFSKTQYKLLKKHCLW